MNDDTVARWYPTVLYCCVWALVVVLCWYLEHGRIKLW